MLKGGTLRILVTSYYIIYSYYYMHIIENIAIAWISITLLLMLLDYNNVML
jgi:hypothetical protein